MLSRMPASNQAIAASGEHRNHQDGAPKPYKANQAPGFRANVLALAQNSQILFLTTLAPDGWPITHDATYAVFADEDQRPVFFVPVRKGSREAFNVRGNPRVSFTIYYALSFEERRKTKAVQIQALANIVGDRLEWKMAADAYRAKEGADIAESAFEFIRIDALSAVYFALIERPQWGTLDYFPASKG